jgi:hypothetical protein
MPRGNSTDIFLHLISVQKSVGDFAKSIIPINYFGLNLNFRLNPDATMAVYATVSIKVFIGLGPVACTIKI